MRICPKCKRPADAAYDKPFCLYCTHKVTGVQAVVSPFSYNKQMRQSILKFKFGNKPCYAKSYAEFMYERLCSYEMQNAFQAIVPVPVSKKRLRTRGYNQTLLLARALSKKCGVPVYDVLRKTINTPPQSTLKYHERLNNLKGSITLQKKCPALPAAVLLIDDVYTTGTTAKVCASVLHQGGAHQILVCTVAMHLPEPDISIESLDL